MVSEATGYPADMLDPELDMEADLGIDTVKQAEVFGAIRESFGIERDDRLKLRDYPTLGHVVGFVRDRTSAASPTESASPADSGSPTEAVSQETGPKGPLAHGTIGAAAHIAATPPEGSIAAANEIPRRVPTPELRPDIGSCAATGVALAQGSRVVIVGAGTDSDDPIGAALARGSRSVEWRPCTSERADGAEALPTAIEQWRREGPLEGVYWLPALDAEPAATRVDLDAFRDAADRPRAGAAPRHAGTGARTGRDASVPGGGHPTRRPARLRARRGGSADGRCSDRVHQGLRTRAARDAGQGGRLRCRRNVTEVAQKLIEETLADPGCVEVGYLDGQRWTIGLHEEPAADGGAGMQLGADSVFVVTGAAGSIVSAIIADLARHCGGTFHLLDLTPEPDRTDGDIARLADDREGLRRDIFDRLKDSGERATPAVVENELARLERLEAALAAIEAVEDGGGTAHYHSVDLRDPAAVGRVVAEVAETHGRIDVLIHAAGLEISRPIADKEPEEFALVFGVKSEGWVNLMAAAGDLPIGATVVFSSVAGRFGNMGQTDYSAANDLLCKFTSNLRSTRPATRGIALDWTAWADIGMATRGSIPKMMAMAGIDMLPAAAGIATVRRELTDGATRERCSSPGRSGSSPPSDTPPAASTRRRWTYRPPARWWNASNGWACTAG